MREWEAEESEEGLVSSTRTVTESADGVLTDLLSEHLPLEPRQVLHRPDVITPPAQSRKCKQKGVRRL